MPQLKKSQSGFTLLEVVASIVISGIFMISLSTLVINLQTINNSAQDLVIANNFIQNKVESLRNGGYISLSVGTFDFTDEMPNTLAPPRSSSYEVFQETVNVSAGNQGLKRLEFNIQYSDRGKTRSIDYVTYIGELGVGQY
jgi:prepilin-type N-terminal cleavage/methylation domain-containing protein